MTNGSPGRALARSGAALVAAVLALATGLAIVQASPSPVPTVPSASGTISVRMDGVSMEPGFANRSVFTATRGVIPHDGDVVIIDAPVTPPAQFIKRVIAGPGDRIEIDGRNSPPRILISTSSTGPLTVLNEPYLHPGWGAGPEVVCCTADGMISPDGLPHDVVVPPGEYFVLGDNRDHSEDSRFFGWVSASAIVAVAPPSQGPISGGPISVLPPTAGGFQEFGDAAELIGTLLLVLVLLGLGTFVVLQRRRHSTEGQPLPPPSPLPPLQPLPPPPPPPGKR